MTTIMDLLKSQLLQSQTIGGLSIEGVLLAMAMAFVAGYIIFLVYRSSNSGVTYINQLAITLVALTMITCLMILTITSNLLLSLGMVGALSIVRFRTAVKEPIDIIYMFWAIAIGIAIGAGFFLLAVLGVVSIGAALFGLSRMAIDSTLYLLVVIFELDSARSDLETAVSIHAKSSRFRSEVALDQKRELTMEIRLKKQSSGIISVIESIPGVKSASLIGVNTNQLY